MKLILFFLVLLLLIVPVSATDWFDSDWNNRRNITIDHLMIDAEMTDFPTMVSITQHGLNTDGNDIRITDSSGNPVAREIECYNETSGGLVFFFDGTSISSTSDTLFWMYYNNSAASEPAADSTYGSEAVWDGNHKFVSHMNNDPGGTPPQLSDSTQNTNDGTSGGAMTSADLVDDDNSKAIEYDGNDYFDCGADASIRANITDFTIIYRVKQPATSTYQGIIATAKNTGTYGYRTGISNSGLVEALIGDASGYDISLGTTVMDDNVWRTVMVTVDSAYLRVHVNGVAEGTPTARTKTIVYDNNLIIGNWANLAAGDYFIGSLSELRILNIAKSTNYIATIHNNLNNPAASGTYPFFLSFGEEESYEAPPTLNGTFLYPNSTYSVGCYGRLISELVYETGFNFSDIDSCNALTTGDMEVLSVDDTNYIQSIDKDAAHDGYMYGNFSLPNVESVNFINVKTVHNRVHTNPVILGLFNTSTQKWHAVNNSSVETVDVELTYNITGTDILKYSTLIDNTLNLSVSLNTNGDGNYDVFVDFVEVYIDYEESPDITLGYVYNLTISNRNNISILQNDVDYLKSNVNNLYLFVLLCTVFLVATLRKRGNQ